MHRHEAFQTKLKRLRIEGEAFLVNYEQSVLIRSLLGHKLVPN